MSYRFSDGYLIAQSDGYVRLNNDGYALLVFDGYNAGFFTKDGYVFDGGKGLLYLTNRVTAPTSNPTGGGYFYAENGDGYWRGSTGVIQSLNNTRIVRTFPTDANYTAVQSDYQAKIMEFTGGLSATRNVVVPIISGYQWTIFNNTTGAQSIQIIGASGTGITIANGKRAIVYADGTDIVRVTADV